MDIQKYLNEAPDLIVKYSTEHGVNIIIALLIFFIGKWFAKMVANLLQAGLRKQKIDDTIVSFMGNIIYSVMLAFVIIAALAQVGIQTTSLIAMLGAAGLAVGLALQGSLSNFASGVLLVSFRPCKVGDYIEAAGIAGTVEDISIFSTVLVTPDNKVITVPNSTIMNGSIVNYSAKTQRRIDLVIGISYDADVRQAKQVLQEIVKRESRVLAEPETKVALHALADSSVNFIVRPWVKTEDYWNVYFDLMEAIKIELDNKGIGIPYPQVDLHIKSNPENA
jgi:small conductance mechanosensitive channel